MPLRKASLLMVLLILTSGCESTRTIGLMSFGDLEGKIIPEKAKGEIRTGKSCGFMYSLSDALRDAFKDTSFDTITDAEVKHETGALVFNNCISTKGLALNSKELKKKGRHEGKVGGKGEPSIHAVISPYTIFPARFFANTPKINRFIRDLNERNSFLTFYQQPRREIRRIYHVTG